MRNVCKTVVCLLTCAAVCAWGQINLLSNDITFRTSGNQARRTTHHGSLDINGGTGNALQVNVTSSGTSDINAVYSYAKPSNGYGWGARCLGGAIGVKGENTGDALTTRSRFGGHFSGTGPSDANQLTVGVFGTASKAYGVTQNCWAGYFNGNVYATGSYQGSDARLKMNVRPLADALDKVMALKPSEYEFDRSRYPDMGLAEGKRVGLVAQEVEAVMPELVTDVALPDEQQKTSGLSSIKAVDYVSVIPVLIAAIQEQQKEIEALKAALGR